MLILSCLLLHFQEEEQKAAIEGVQKKSCFEDLRADEYEQMLTL